MLNAENVKFLSELLEKYYISMLFLNHTKLLWKTDKDPRLSLAKELVGWVHYSLLSLLVINSTCKGWQVISPPPLFCIPVCSFSSANHILILLKGSVHSKMKTSHNLIHSLIIKPHE